MCGFFNANNMSIQRDRDQGGEKLKTNMMGVFEETSPLKKVVMWGQPGPEAVIAQILPEDKSCFLEDFSVTEARKEFDVARTMIEAHGVEIFQVKDLLIKMIEEQELKAEHPLDELKDTLVQKALSYSKKYPNGNTDEIENIGDMVEEDIDKYKNENAVIKMNEMLSLSHEFDLPLANIIFARDQSNVAGGAWIWSSMRHEIRQPEVALYQKVLEYSGVVSPSNFDKIVKVTGDGRFEGGDGIVNNSVYYIGLGGRTNWEGITQVAPTVLSQGLRLIVCRDVKRAKGLDNEMAAMHLDTIWMPSDLNTIVACNAQMDRRFAFEVTEAGGKLQVKGLGKMPEHMDQRGARIISLSDAEQQAFAPNFLNLGNDVIILSLVDEKSVDKKAGELTIKEKLEKEGKTVLDADLQAITKGYGGLHCMTAAIKRG